MLDILASEVWGCCGGFFVVPILNLLVKLQKLLNFSILYYDEHLN